MPIRTMEALSISHSVRFIVSVKSGFLFIRPSPKQESLKGGACFRANQNGDGGEMRVHESIHPMMRDLSGFGKTETLCWMGDGGFYFQVPKVQDRVPLILKGSRRVGPTLPMELSDRAPAQIVPSISDEDLDTAVTTINKAIDQLGTNLVVSVDASGHLEVLRRMGVRN